MAERWIDETLTGRELEEQLHAYVAVNHEPEEDEGQPPADSFRAALDRLQAEVNPASVPVSPEDEFLELLARHLGEYAPVTPFDR